MLLISDQSSFINLCYIFLLVSFFFTSFLFLLLLSFFIYSYLPFNFLFLHDSFYLYLHLSFISHFISFLPSHLLIPYLITSPSNLHFLFSLFLPTDSFTLSLILFTLSSIPFPSFLIPLSLFLLFLSLLSSLSLSLFPLSFHPKSSSLDRNS